MRRPPAHPADPIEVLKSLVAWWDEWEHDDMFTMQSIIDRAKLALESELAKDDDKSVFGKIFGDR